VTAGYFGQTGICFAVFVLTVVAALSPAQAQSPEPAGSATVQGYVRDSSGRPVATATVFLRRASGTDTLSTEPQITHTDSEGGYRFSSLQEGSYSLRAEMNEGAASVSPVSVSPKETRKIDLVLISTKSPEPKGGLPEEAAPWKPDAHAPEFFDEPQFTVAGVTQATNAGGHGSDTVLRTTEALAKATVSLSKESSGSSAGRSVETESSLRDAIAREPEDFDANRRLGKFLVDNGKGAEGVSYLERASRLNPKDPELHGLLGDVDEKLGNPLEAVQEHQRAAELDPSEPHLFDWGSELLAHRALEPATGVFAKGNRLFPKSVRMLIALGVAWYARGSYEQAAQCLVNASDLAPDNPTPYLFLGKMQSAETAPSEESARRLARFAQLHPDDALANYYYAVSLWKQSTSSTDSERLARVELLLQKAVHLDPKLGAAYLQLGILYSQRADFSRAISAYQKAIAVTPEEVGPEQITREQGIPEQVTPDVSETLEVAHYRLAQAYLRTGDKTKAQEELQLHDRLAKKTKEHTERERRETLQFVISLQSKQKKSVSSPQP
jgi:tetratricopeptide (TPR) repeat protein